MSRPPDHVLKRKSTEISTSATQRSPTYKRIYIFMIYFLFIYFHL